MNATLMDRFPKGCEVDVYKMEGDQFNHDFTGTVIGYHAEYVTVLDADGDSWDCEEDQISIVEE